VTDSPPAIAREIIPLAMRISSSGWGDTMRRLACTRGAENAITQNTENIFIMHLI
jgi:hypothetical protein